MTSESEAATSSSEIAEAESPPRDRERAAPITALVGIVIAFVCIGALFALQQPPYVGPDEKAHVGYAHTVAGGDLPTIEDRARIPDSATQWAAEFASTTSSDDRTIWVANHPPLHPLLVTPIVWYSNATDRPDGGLLLLRFANIGFAAVGIVLTYALAMEVTSGRRRLSVIAAGMAAMTTQAHASLSLAMNDGLGFAAGTAVLWAGVRCIRHGTTNRNLALLATTVVIASGARTATMLMAIAVVAVVCVDAAVRPADSLHDRLWFAVATAVAGLLPATALFGWFYERNVDLYGDIGASSYLLERFDRQPRGSIVSILADVDRWQMIYHRLMSPHTVGATHPPLMVPLAVGALFGLAVVFVTRRGGERDSSGDRYPVSRRVLALLAVGVAVVVVTMAQHLSGGGFTHPRYMFPALGALATLGVLGFDRLLPRWLPAAVLAGMAAWTLAQIPVDVDPRRVSRPRDGLAATPAPLRVLPASDAWRTAAGVGVAIGCVLAAAGLAAMLVERRAAAAIEPTEPTGELSPLPGSATGGR